MSKDKATFRLSHYYNKFSNNTHVLHRTFGNHYAYVYLNANKEDIPKTEEAMRTVFNAARSG